jgi:hypothetical protein
MLHLGISATATFAVRRWRLVRKSTWFAEHNYDSAHLYFTAVRMSTWLPCCTTLAPGAQEHLTYAPALPNASVTAHLYFTAVRMSTWLSCYTMRAPAAKSTLTIAPALLSASMIARLYFTAVRMSYLCYNTWHEPRPARAMSTEYAPHL